MTEITEAEFEKNFDDYMDRIETNGEEFLIRRADGSAVVAVPAGQLEPLADDMTDEEWYNMFNDHDDAP